MWELMTCEVPFRGVSHDLIDAQVTRGVRPRIPSPLPEGFPAAYEQLITRCRAALGPIKAPKSVEVWAEIPRSPVGKVLRREVRDRYWTGGSRIL